MKHEAKVSEWHLINKRICSLINILFLFQLSSLNFIDLHLHFFSIKKKCPCFRKPLLIVSICIDVFFHFKLM